MLEEVTTEWCAGLPLVLRRDISEEERESLRRTVRRLQMLGLVSIVLFPVSCGLFMLFVLQSNSNDTVVLFLVFLGVMLVFLGLPISLLAARDCFRRRKGLIRDLAAGYIKRFAGEINSALVFDETFLLLQKARLAPNGQSTTWNFEILPCSGCIWQVMDAPVPRWLAAQTVEIANTPEFAEIAAQWLEPISKIEAATLLSGHREMSASERQELLRYARRLWTRVLPLAVGTTLWVSMPIVVLITKHGFDSLLYWIQFVSLAVTAVLYDFLLISNLIQARRLKQDERIGCVQIHRMENPATHDEFDAASIQNSSEVEVVELLPISRRVWTLDGRPAPWRMV